jgi:hypothetical protein
VKRLFFAAVLLVAALAGRAVAQEPLTDRQVDAAILLGKAGTVPVVQIAASPDFDVLIKGPVGRIAAAAAYAAKQFRPFALINVTPEMKASNYVVTVLATRDGRYLAPTHIVLQPKGATGADGVIQPASEDENVDSPLIGHDATFVRFPPGDFEVVVVTTDGSQRFGVTADQRAQIR